jgi:tetratricopeptide (TPR) repeat protein
VNRFSLLLVTFALVGQVVACNKHDSAPNVDNVASEWTQLVRDAHGQADRAKSDEQRRLAIQGFRKALQTAPQPANARLQWVIQDLYFRLAQALVDSRELSEAEAAIVRGLAVSAEPSVARANLLALQGKVYEAQGKPEQAARVLHDALLINEVLFERALQGEVEERR